MNKIIIVKGTMTVNVMTLTIMTQSMMTLRIMPFNDTQQNFCKHTFSITTH
jgi:hypothetical protein